MGERLVYQGLYWSRFIIYLIDWCKSIKLKKINIYY